jgi:hypothetical protein
MASSCQNDIENELNIFEETATTRAIDEDNEIEKDSPIRSISISGDDIISGTEQKTYTAPSYNQTTYKMNWVYDSSAFTCMAGGGDNNYITIKLTDPERLANADLRAELLYRYNNTLHSADTKTIACNGPFAGTSSVRIVRSSDGVEVYPASVGLSPNTFYYAYFTNTMASNMDLDWDITNTDTSYFSSWGYIAYFKTNSVGYCFLTVRGKMPYSNVYKTLLNNITLYGGAK